MKRRSAAWSSCSLLVSISADLLITSGSAAGDEINYYRQRTATRELET